MAGKLHELLAVEQDLAGAYKKILDESSNTFKNKADFFYGFVKAFYQIFAFVYLVGLY